MSDFSKLTGYKYCPIDEILEVPSVRVLRAIRFHDWRSTYELVDQLLGSHEDEQAVNSITVAIMRLARAGALESRRMPGSRLRKSSDLEYRITPKGRELLASMLKRQDPFIEQKRWCTYAAAHRAEKRAELHVERMAA